MQCWTWLAPEVESTWLAYGLSRGPGSITGYLARRAQAAEAEIDRLRADAERLAEALLSLREDYIDFPYNVREALRQHEEY